LLSAEITARMGTEDIYKIYAESFQGADHLRRILEEAQKIVSDALAAPVSERGKGRVSPPLHQQTVRNHACDGVKENRNCP
jgi:hypothetical protein